MEKRNIIIIGAGAAGILAAITAARNHAKVTLLEHTDRIGKKLLSTGNGRCNITNLLQKSQFYRSENVEFPKHIIDQFNEAETLKLFEEIGIYTKDKFGYVYPYSEQASTVLDILKLELDRLEVNIIYQVKVTNVITKGRKIQVITNQQDFVCDKVIISTGSMAAPKTGSDGSGYQIAKIIGHHIIKPLPALVQLRCSGDYFKSLAGIRCEAELSLLIDGQVKLIEQGELQLTDYGISGIPTFQISRYAVRAIDQKNEVFVHIDFIPEMKEEDLNAFLRRQIKMIPQKNIENILIGLLNKKLVPVLLNRVGISTKIIGKDLKDKQIERIIQIIKRFEVEVESFNSFEQAQVCSGGVDTLEVSATTLESNKMQGVYFAGEILDVDGICGGYNLQWAWSSGYVAGYHACID
jgi:predicted Rossmann fold flavoprotein